jgi:hypothetical protein
MFRTASVLGALLATTTAVAACGGSSPTNTTSASTHARSGNALRMAQCMRSHGVPDFPDPSSGGGFAIQAGANGNSASITVDGHSLNVSGPAFRRATDACAKYGPHGPAVSGAQLAQIRQGAVKMAECMRTHGVPDFPDPKVTTGPGGQGIAVAIGAPGAGGARKLDPGSPAFANAQKICQKYMRVGPKGAGASK